MEERQRSRLAGAADGGNVEEALLGALGQLSMSRLRFSLRLKQPIASLPTYYGSMLRGGLGIQFRQLVCVQPHIRNCKECALIRQCAFPYIFETPLPLDVLSAPHLQDVSPYTLTPVTRASSLAAGDLLQFDLTLFGKAIEYLPYLVVSFRQLGLKKGLGRTRARYDLEEVNEETPGRMAQSLYVARTGTVNMRAQETTLAEALPLAPKQVNRVRLQIQTPMRIKAGSKVTNEPDVGDLCTALLRRLSQLVIIHGHGVWDVEDEAVLQAAAAIKIDRYDLRNVQWERYSSRQRQSIRMGGIVGEIELCGELRPLLPLLWAGQWMRIGRGATFGNGQYVLRICG